MPASSLGAPSLSICIATLNRAKYIADTLDSITNQLTSEVEIVVLDGGSTDGTEAIMREREKTCPALHYIRQAKNHGIDEDYSTAVDMCSGEYVWLMTDDDLLKPGAISTVIESSRHKPSLVVVNAEIRNSNMSLVLQPRRMQIDTDALLTSADALMTIAGDYLSFIGCVIIRRDIWQPRKKQPYFGSLFIHVGVIFQEPLPGNALLIAEPLIAIRYGNAMWRPKEFEIWMFKWPNLIWSFRDVSDQAKSAVCKPEPWRSMLSLLLLRAKGRYTKDEYKTWLRPRFKGSWRRHLAALIAHVPGPLVNGAAVAYGVIAHRGIHTGIFDLKASRFYFRNWFSSPQ